MYKKFSVLSHMFLNTFVLNSVYTCKTSWTEETGHEYNQMEIGSVTSN